MQQWAKIGLWLVLTYLFATNSVVGGKVRKVKYIRSLSTAPPIKTDTKKGNACERLQSAVSKKELASFKLMMAVSQLKKDMESKADNAEYAESQINILEIFSRQLNYNEVNIYQTIDWLTDSLAGKVKDFSNVKRSISRRLKSLRDATFHEEQDYHQLLLAEKNINKTRELNAQVEGGLLGEILSEVAAAADNLESDLGDIVVGDAAIEQRLLGKNGENIEALVRMSSRNEDLQRLEDANGNQFVISKGRDSTQPLEDTTLLLDLVYVVVTSTILSHMTSLFALPVMFGQVLCGVILGPSAFNILVSLVQLETLAELGVFFIMFTVGLEFSPKRIKQILVISLLGSFGLMAILIACTELLSLVLTNSTLAESAFIGACFSLSSTPLVVKFTAPQAGAEETGRSGRQEYVDVLMGILVLQDVLMGLLVAFLPALAGHGSVLASAGILVHILLAFLLVTLISAVFVLCMQKVKVVISGLSTELLTLTSTGLAFFMMWVTFQLGVSMELGCFLAGSIISAGGESLAGRVETLVSPIKDFLSNLFFTAIGLHVFPSFVMVELGLLALATALVISFKFGASVAVMKMSLPKQSQRYSYIIAAGLSQVSEFSFVLSSRARHLHLISREIYLLVLSVSTLSLLMAPFLWKIVLVTEYAGGRTRASDSTSRSISRQNSLTSG